MTTDDTRPHQTMPIRGYPTWIGIPKKEYERHAALVAAARALVDSVRPWDYDAPQFDSDALAALRAALDGEPHGG